MLTLQGTATEICSAPCHPAVLCSVPSQPHSEHSSGVSQGRCVPPAVAPISEGSAESPHSPGQRGLFQTSGAEIRMHRDSIEEVTPELQLEEDLLKWSKRVFQARVSDSM